MIYWICKGEKEKEDEVTACWIFAYTLLLQSASIWTSPVRQKACPSRSRPYPSISAGWKRNTAPRCSVMKERKCSWRICHINSCRHSCWDRNWYRNGVTDLHGRCTDADRKAARLGVRIRDHDAAKHQNYCKKWRKESQSALFPCSILILCHL